MIEQWVAVLGACSNHQLLYPGTNRSDFTALLQLFPESGTRPLWQLPYLRAAASGALPLWLLEESCVTANVAAAQHSYVSEGQKLLVVLQEVCVPLNGGILALLQGLQWHKIPPTFGAGKHQLLQASVPLLHRGIEESCATARFARMSQPMTQGG